MRHRTTFNLVTMVAALALWACGADDQHVEAPTKDAGAATAAPQPEGGQKIQDAPPTAGAKAANDPATVDPLRHRDDLPPDRRVVLIIDGEERVVDEATAKKHGYTVLDLRHDWTPFIFQPVLGPDGQEMENRYRRIFIGLANDESDGDGNALPKNERNYLEVFGIPPSIGVIRKRFVDDAASECLQGIDYAAIAAIDGMTYRSNAKQRRHERRIKVLEKKLKKAMKDAKVDSLDALKAAEPDLADEIEDVVAERKERAAMKAIDKRLDCDEHDHKRYRHKDGKLDHGLRLALRRFQRKHKLYEHTNLRKKTMKMLATPPIETNFASFERAMRERVVAATSILEDGTAKVDGKPATYVGKDGGTYEVRNLVEEFTQAALQGMGTDTPEKALAFFQRHPQEDFEWLRVGVKMPPLPEYHSAHMELDMVVDRGDVWYDPPWDDEGNKVRQPRSRMPKLYLYVTYRDQRFPLVRWPTTIGGWRAEMAANGYEYFKYKGSDIGDRVIRKIISGPTWIPPKTTPLRSLAKRRYVNGKAQNIVNYDEMGPGYLSAYGLVAGYFVIPGRDGRPDHDRGIRAHGSSDFMSIRSPLRFSHGCHRLLNHHAVRLYGFILNHRHMVVDGDQELNHTRQFFYKDHVYEVRVPSRGFQYRLEPPLEVKVLPGRIRSEARKPPEGLVKIPGTAYPNGMPGDEEGDEEDRSGGGGGADEEDA